MIAPTETSPIPIRRPRNTAFCLAALLASVILLCLLAIGIYHAAHPPWHTFTAAPVSSDFPLRLMISYPEGWVCKSRDNFNGMVLVTRRPPTGFARWWEEHVLHQDSKQQQMTGMGFLLQESYSSPAELELEYRQIPIRARTIRRLQLPLGPAVEVSISLPGFAARGRFAARQPLNHRMLFIFPPCKPGRKAVMIIAIITFPIKDFSRFMPTFDEISRRLRVVEK